MKNVETNIGNIFIFSQQFCRDELSFKSTGNGVKYDARRIVRITND